MKLFTTGYGRWPTGVRLAKLLEALKEAEIKTVVDVRIVPCSSNLDPKSNYGPKAWTLQWGKKGISWHLRKAGIEYLWMAELGNPQPKPPGMEIFRKQLASADPIWPVTRGLARLKELVKGKRVCLLCACKKPEECHGSLIAGELSRRYFANTLEVERLR